MLPGGTAPEVGSRYDDGVARFGGSGLDEARGVGRREADEGVAPELLVLVGFGGDEGEVLRGDDLVGVDVVADDVAEAVEGGGGGRRRGRRGGAWRVRGVGARGGGGGDGDGAWG